MLTDWIYSIAYHFWKIQDHVDTEVHLPLSYTRSQMQEHAGKEDSARKRFLPMYLLGSGRIDDALYLGLIAACQRWGPEPTISLESRSEILCDPYAPR